MSDCVQPVALLIADPSGSSPAGEAVEAWIRESGIGFARRSDVYRGLARALSHEQPIEAVLVGTDALADDEFEFFTVLCRARRNTLILVFGENAQKIVQALQHGASGLVTREALFDLLPKMQRMAETRILGDTAAVASEPEPTSPIVEPALGRTPPIPLASPGISAERPQISLEEADEDAEEPPSASEEDATGTVRVPWLRYQGGPARIAPGSAGESQARTDQAPTAGNHRRPQESTRPVAETNTVADEKLKVPPAAAKLPVPVPPECLEEYEPLLTEAELAALLGDDDLKK